MINPEKQLYKNFEIKEYPWVIEHLEEKFDNALSLLDKKCVVYGGAIRDSLAGLPIKGDLDISMPRDWFNIIQKRFMQSIRWHKEFIPLNKLVTSNSAIPTTSKKILSSVETFTNISAKSIQLIAPYTCDNVAINGIDSGIIDIVTNVDIVCCGVLTDIFGTVYEIVPGAFEDCKNKVLNFNFDIKVTRTSIKQLKLRITKLEQRGWVNNININKIEVIEESIPKVNSKIFGKF